MSQIGIVKSHQNIYNDGPVGENLRYGVWGFYGVSQALEHMGISYDVLDDETASRPDGLSRFRVVIYPEMPILTAAQRKAFREYVEAGGTAIADGYFAIYKDGSLTPWIDPPAGEIAEQTGAEDEFLGVKFLSHTGRPGADAGEPNIAGYMVGEYSPIFRRMPKEVPAFGWTRLVEPAEDARAVGTYVPAVPGGAPDPTGEGSCFIIKQHGKGMTVYIGPRLFRTIGIVLSGQAAPEYWVSRTEYFPSADNTGGVHPWEHGGVYRSLRAAGWATTALGEYYDRLVSNLLEWAAAEGGWVLPSVWFYPDHKPFAFVVTYDVDHAEPGKRWYFEDWVNLHKEMGIHPHGTWLFQSHLDDVSAYPHSSLAEYSIYDAEIKEAIADLVEQGYEVGLHHGHWDADVIAAELSRFKEATGIAPRGTRAHYLTEGPYMLKALNEGGLEWDSSWFTHQELAPMNGTYHPFRPLFVEGKEILDIIELPAFYTDWMQVADWRSYGMKAPVTHEDLAAAMETVKNVNGLWVIGLHHTGREPLEQCYDNFRHIVGLAVEKGGWAVGGDRLARWWNARRHISLTAEKDGDKITLHAVRNGPDEYAEASRGTTLSLELPAGVAVERVVLDGKTDMPYETEDRPTRKVFVTIEEEIHDHTIEIFTAAI